MPKVITAESSLIAEADSVVASVRAGSRPPLSPVEAFVVYRIQHGEAARFTGKWSASGGLVAGAM